MQQCVLAPFVGGSTSQQIPFVYLPLRGQIINPGKAISLTGIQTPVCAVSAAKYMTEDGWVDLRNPVDSDVPFRLVSDEGRAFLQWAGETELRNRLSGRLVMVNIMCRELSTTESTEIPRIQMIFSPCVAFRVVGTPTIHLSNVSEVAFVQDTQTEASSSTSSESMSVSEYVAIGICSVLLGLIYVASVFLYLHLRKRNREKDAEKNGENKSIKGIEEGIVKNNPLLSMPAHFIQTDQAYSDTNSSDNDAAPDIIKHHEDRKKQITSALVHPQSQHFNFKSHRSTFSSFEHAHQDSSTNERLPEENVSIIETLEVREERPDNIKALSGSTRKKLYFNPAYFEPHLLMAPPPAALEFLTKIREVIAIAKQKLESKRFSPSLINIPEEENHYAIDPLYGFANPGSRRSSIISLKRENSRRKLCSGCPGCGPQEFESLSGKLPEFSSLVACQSCTMTSNESKQRSIRKWLEDVPILKDTSEQNQTAAKPARCPKRVRSPTKSLSLDDYDGSNGALSSENNIIKSMGIINTKPPVKEQRKTRKPPPPPVNKDNIGEENIYDTVPIDIERGITMQFPPPDMIQQAMEVERSEEKVATLTKEQMNAVINEFTIHKNLIMPLLEGDSEEDRPIAGDYETDSLERTGNKGGYSTPSDYAEISSSQPSPSLSTVLPDQEEMTMRNAIFNKKTGNMTISKINMDNLRENEDDHDYELIVMKKGAIIEHGSYKLPELLQRNNRYSLVSEVYVNSGYNYGSAPSTPGGSRYSTLDRKTLKVRYENDDEKPGKLLIEVEDCLDHYIPVHDSDEYETDTLDRKPSRRKAPDCAREDEKIADNSLERPTQILLKTTGSFRSDALAPPAQNSPQKDSNQNEESNFNRAFGSLREIYEAKTRGVFKGVERRDSFADIGDEEKGKTLTLEERHARRQRAKGAIVQPDVIPPPPRDSSLIYEHPRDVREVHATDSNHIKPPLPSKNSNGRSVGNMSTRSNAPIGSHTYTRTGTPERLDEEHYELCLLQKSKKNGAITNFIQTDDVVLKKDSKDQFIVYPYAKKQQTRTWNAARGKPEDSGYLSSDSNDKGAVADLGCAVADHGGAAGSETDESLGDGHSESGAESVETHSVFFGRIPRNMALFRGYGSMDSGVIGGEEGPSSSDSETVSYTTVIPVTTGVTRT
ncbi:hypothetical protein JTB14_027195 [Gonioctena quinquepunctata]|nr:hypothetical protein JTB14_027195 [Gonioctena quinquepunctata]